MKIANLSAIYTSAKDGDVLRSVRINTTQPLAVESTSDAVSVSNGIRVLHRKLKSRCCDEKEQEVLALPSMVFPVNPVRPRRAHDGV